MPEGVAPLLYAGWLGAGIPASASRVYSLTARPEAVPSWR
jgi:hypothetical protein